MKVFQSLARALSEASQGPLFGLVGDANLYLVDSFVREYLGTYVGAANEGGAALMALGHASVSGNVGIATVTHGPAVTNTMTALVEGVKSSIPMLLLCGDTAEWDRENLQNISQRDVILSTGAGFEQVLKPETAATDFARAFRRAVAERRPIALNIPTNFLWQEVEYVPGETRITLSQPEIIPAGEDLDNAIGIIAAAKRPIILAGRSAANSGARNALIQLAERIEAPLATTLRAKDLFLEVDYNLGIFGTLSSPDAVDAIIKSDCVIAFGASLNSYTTSNGAYLEGKRVLQIAESEKDIGNYHVPDIGLIGGHVEAVKTMIHWLDEAEIAPSGFTGELPKCGLATHPVSSGNSGEQHLDFISTLDGFNKILPQNRILVTDAGRHMLKSMQYLNVATPRDYVPTAGFGSIGLGMGFAVGAAASEPERTVVLIVGDGGFMLGGLAEFNTAVRHNMNIIVIVCNDGSYGAEHVQLRDKQMDPGISLFEWPDFAPLAIALGGNGIVVRELADMKTVKHAIESTQRPLLIELKLDPDNMPMY